MRADEAPEYAEIDPVLLYLAREFPQPLRAHALPDGHEGPVWLGVRHVYAGRLAPVPLDGAAGDLAAALALLPDRRSRLVRELEPGYLLAGSRA